MKAWSYLYRDYLKDEGQRNVLFVSLCQCASAISFTFIDTIMPFYIFKVSPYGQRETLFWVGAIMGVVGFFLMVTAPLWGVLTHRFNPKILYMRAQMANGLVFLLTGFTTNLHLLFVLKLLQGVFGGVSTVGLVLVSSSSTKEKLPLNIGFFQSCLTLGQLAGPPLGSFMAATLGYRTAFICGFLLITGAVLLCLFKVTDVPKLPRQVKKEERHLIDRKVIAGWLICVVAQIQLVFLPSILPKILEGFKFYSSHALRLAGIVIMVYTAAAAIGSFILTRLAKKMELIKLITLLVFLSTIFQILLVFPEGLFSFTIIRMGQTYFTAAVIPLVFSIFAGQKRGAVIGIINSSRFGGSAVGPVIATSTYALFGQDTLFLLISLLTLVVLINFRYAFRDD
ncbi:MAG: MFS transporter [Syntrophorhabdaceae bacterium]|nr:MFS transporter [Syntrophorhabdaceae bacterium]